MFEHSFASGDDGRRTAVKGRFAPSPTGRMHAGNIFAALMCWLIVRSLDGRVILRIEDLDVERSKACYIDQVQRDFEMLGLTWDEGPYFQHDRESAYREAFEELKRKNLLYPCYCTRTDLHAASAPHRGEKFVYPGTCRDLSDREREMLGANGRAPAMRLKVPDGTYELEDLIQGAYRQNLARDCGDFIVRRSDGLFAYQLAVVVDDAQQGVNIVVRGVDLLASTPQQMYLQHLFSHDRCLYAHVPLLVAEKDRRLSKRDKDASLDELLSRFGSAEAVLGHIAYVAGLSSEDEPRSCDELLAEFDTAHLSEMFPDPIQILWH